MIPAAFDYHRAMSVDDALELLGRFGDDAKVLAGGHSLIPMMKLRFARPATLVDIARIAELRGIVGSDAGLRIGATTSHADVAASPDVLQYAPALSDAANHLGDLQVRNRGTIGGACAHGDPSADYPAVMLALDATLAVTSRAGVRTVRADDFFRDMFDTDIEPGELVTSLHIDATPQSAYIKLPHPASGYAVLGVAVALGIARGRINSARVAVTGLTYTQIRLPSVEERLSGIDPHDAAAIAAACAGAAAGIETRGDSYASGPYRAAVCDTLVERALDRALTRVPLAP